MAKANLKKEASALIEKGKVPKRVNGKMRVASDGGEILITKLEENVVAYDFVTEGRRVLVMLPSEDGNQTIMKESKIPEPKPVEEAAPKAVKVPKVPEAPKEPVWVEQKNEKGEVEQVDFNLYSNMITCIECGEIRYVKNADKHQVVRCKPHARKARRKAIRERKKARGKANKFLETKAAEKKAKKEAA